MAAVDGPGLPSFCILASMAFIEQSIAACTAGSTLPAIGNGLIGVGYIASSAEVSVEMPEVVVTAGMGDLPSDPLSTTLARRKLLLERGTEELLEDAGRETPS